ncbi:interleukin-31 receptor subunit alpha-like [Hippoglossus hippoglossus]|uniref:interleukin-31 receptor subunit alpha-like n=1 Tax=Hippoglossus hippoglossus TaxID=8267 RepID=UPI00148CC7AE|nr:interleukin-31 receptor subunit alpha-like [Hippoglossus hippoglossus]
MQTFQVTFILALILFVVKGLHGNSCDVYPKDPFIEVGSDTEVFCQRSCVQGEVYWTQDNKIINESLSNTINNSTHSVLSLTNFTQHSAALECHSANIQQILGGTIIKTYTKPSKISCMLHYDEQEYELYPQLFTCNWEHQNNSSREINYTLFVSSSSVTRSGLCNSHVTTCTAKDFVEKIILSETLAVTVRAKTDAWEADSDTYEFEFSNILKIIPPKIDVSVESNNLKIEWKRSKAMGKINCQDKYTETVGNKTPNVNKSTLESGKDGKVSRKVDSCRNYKVSVRCALDRAPWSDWSPEKTVLTKFNKSDVKLHLWRTVTKLDTNGIRKVHAMWKPIPATCEGTFSYKIQQIPYKQHTTGLNYTETSCSNSTCDVDVNEEEHRVDLTVFHNESPLAKDSVYVPAAAGSRPQVTEIQTSATEGVVLVSWTAPVQPVRGYMIDWTHDGNQYYWNETKYTNTSLFDLLDKKQYNITVTPLFDDKTGRGSQAVQICSRIGDPDNISVASVRANHRSASVSWITQSQEECSGAVINYRVFYRTPEGPMLNVNSTKRDVLLKDLNPDTQYIIYIEATASTGTSKSNESSFKTKRFDPRMITVLSVCGSIVIIIVLSLGLCCTIQWKKFREKPVPDPGLSSLAEWLLPDHQKGMCLFQAFSNPSESFCDRVFTEEMQKTPACPSASGYYPESDEAEEYNVHTPCLTSKLQNEKPDEHVETHPCSSAEFTDLLSPGNKPLSPYRSQRSVETPDLRTSKQSKRVPVKQPENKAPMTVYVSLNMLKEGPVIETESISNIQEYIRPE